MKILTWNLNRPKDKLSSIFQFLRHEIEADVLLLQETYRIDQTESEDLIFEESYGAPVKRNEWVARPQKWGVAIWSRRGVIKQITIQGFENCPGRVVVGEIQIDAEPISFVSIHAPIMANHGVATASVFPHLANALNQILATLNDKKFVIGGDLNSDRALGQRLNGRYGHTAFWNEVDSGSRFHDCHFKANGREISTYISKKNKHDFQDDHIFVSPSLAKAVKDCRVIDTPETRSLGGNEHLPVLLDVDL